MLLTHVMSYWRATNVDQVSVAHVVSAINVAHLCVLPTSLVFECQLSSCLGTNLLDFNVACG